MRRNLAFPIVFAMCSPMLAQTYTISTLAKTNSAAGVAGVAVDSSGVVYYSDGQQLKKMTPSGAVSVIAGVAFGALTTGGDGGPASAATFNIGAPGRLAIDGQNNLYIFDDHRVRRIGPDGNINAFVGQPVLPNPAPVYSGATVPALTFALGHPADWTSLGLDPAGNLLIAPSNFNYVFKVSSGTLAPVAGGATFGTSQAGDGGPALKAFVPGPHGVAADAAGNIYIAQPNFIRKVSTNGLISTVAGSPTAAITAIDGGLATNSPVFPADVAVDKAGNLYIADDGLANRVRKVTPQGIISTIAGGGTSRDPLFSGNATDAILSAPMQITVDANGNIYFTTFDGTVRKLTPSGGSVTPPPTISDGGILNSASYAKSQPPAAGSIMTLFGSNLANALVVTGAAIWPTTLGSVTLTVNNTPAPLYYVSATQIAFQLPFGLSGTVPVVVSTNGVASNSASLTLGAASPGIFTTNTQGTGQGSIPIANSDVIVAPAGSIPGRTTRPAQRGVDYISIFCTGLGAVNGSPVTGAPADVLNTTTPATVTIGGTPATVIYAGLAPGFVGLYQVNALVPAGSQAGDAVPLTLVISGVTSNPVTIAVQ